MTKQTFQATNSSIKQNPSSYFKSNPKIQYNNNSFKVKPTKMMSVCGGRGLRPDPFSPTGVNHLSPPFRNRYAHSAGNGKLRLRGLLASEFSCCLLKTEGTKRIRPEWTVESSGKWTSQLMFYVHWRPMKSFSDGFLVSIGLSGTDLKYLIKVLILSPLGFK